MKKRECCILYVNYNIYAYGTSVQRCTPTTNNADELVFIQGLVSFQSPVWFLFVNLPHCKQVSRSGFVRCSGMRKVRLKHPIVIVACSGGTNGSITVCATWLQ